jgi:hypothetical protein
MTSGLATHVQMVGDVHNLLRVGGIIVYIRTNL